MEFLIIVLFFIALSNSLSLNWFYPYDVQGIPAPSRLLYSQYSIHQSLLPRNDAPNIFSLTQGTPVGEAVMTGLSISLQGYLYLMTEGIRYACGYGLCLLRLSISEHFHCHIFESVYPCTSPASLLLKHDTCSLLPKQYGNLNYSLNENCFDIEPFGKFKTFIETKVSAMKLQCFNL